MRALKNWMTAATAKEKVALARRAKTSVPHLFQLSGGHRRASAELAISIEKAALTLRKINPTLPELRREDMNGACRGCDFARRCRE